jgi:hypothetical protein
MRAAAQSEELPAKHGLQRSTESAIVVARRSWLEISLWKTGKTGRKKKSTQLRREMVSEQPSTTAEIR